MRNSAVLLLLICFACSSALAANAVQGCGTYSRTGILAGVNVRHGVHLSLTTKDKAPTELDMPLPFAVSGCRVAFSHDSELLAISLDPEGKAQPMQVALLDVNRLQWVKPAPIKIALAPDSRGEMIGFLRDTHDLLMLSSGLYFAGENRTTVFAAVVDPIAGKTTTSAVAVPAMGFSRVDTAVDLPEGRIWIAQEDGPPCHLRSYPLGRRVTELSHAIPDSDCTVADLLVATGENSILKVSHESDGVTLHLIDGRSGKAEAASLAPRDHGDSYWVQGGYAVSADGKVIAIAVKHFRHGRLGAVRVGNDIVAIGTAPLRVLGSASFDALPKDFVVRESDEGIAISTLTDAGWTNRTISKSN